MEQRFKKRMQCDNPDIIITPQDNIVINPNSVNLTLNDTIAIYSDPVLDMKKRKCNSKISDWRRWHVGLPG